MMTSWDNRSIKKQITWGFSLVMVVSMLLIIWLQALDQRENIVEQHHKQAESLAKSISAATAVWMATRDYSGIQEIVDGLEDFPSLCHVIILDTSGLVVANTDSSKVGLYLPDLPAQPKQFIYPTKPTEIDIAYPIQLNQQLVGWVRLGLDDKVIQQDLASVLSHSLGYAFISLLFGLLVANWISHQLTKRLHYLADVANKVQSGDTHVRSELTGKDELAGLSFAMNDMLDVIHDREQRIHQLAYFDFLTGLPNRAYLYQKLNTLLSQQDNQYHALLFLDLDLFKTLNDTLGHDMGDNLLQQVGKVLELMIANSGMAARIGGDEFVIVLCNINTDIETAHHFTQEIAAQILYRLNLPFKLGEHEYQSTVSIGAVVFNSQAALQAQDILKQADIAMYQAKKAGRHQVRFFDPEVEAAIQKRAQIERELQRALSLGQLLLYLQPQLNQEGKVIGAEALMRWLHPVEGFIPPAHFIPIAEETGVILTIGRWILDQACAELARWQQNPATANLTISVNISAQQFMQTSFTEQVKHAIARHEIPPSRLKLELTESVLLSNTEQHISTMQELANFGVGFSLDDFGTGYSSLQYLKRLPLYQLKIDQSFVRDLLKDMSDLIIAQTIISMAQALHLNVIAEGVEEEEQRQKLLSLGCQTFQGYLFSKPISCIEFENWLVDQKTI